jgi:uncharacterized protein YndB with AHSA1/START domain
VSDEKKALIYIPDISGFTRFVNATEIHHSQHIIEELLEVLLESNNLNLEVSEIEGDAILFYRTGEPPQPDQIGEQIKKMFINFHSYLQVIERDTVCQCGACRTVSRLTIKFFIHFGEIGISKIREHTKLMGKNIILSHRLMKNDIESDEYLLMTTEFTQLQDGSQMKASLNWSDLKEGKITYDHIGEVAYQYIELSSLRDQIKPVKPASDAEKYKNPIVFSTHIDAPMDFVYRIVTDLALRTRWSEGLNKLTYDENEIPRLGSKHICDLSAGLVELETVQNKRQGKKIEYAEKATKSYIFPKATTFFIIEDDNGETKFSAQFHYKRIFVIGWVIDLILSKNLEKNFQKSAKNLKNFCEAEIITKQTQQYT